MRRDPAQRDGPTGAADPRPRYGRMTAAGASLLVTLVSVLGGLGVLPGDQASALASSQSSSLRADAQGSGDPAAGRGPAFPGPASGAPSTSSTSAPAPGQGSIQLSGGSYAPESPSAGSPSLPADSGSGRRIVFDMTTQRVWLVGQRGSQDVVRRTYLVSGSVTDNLRPGTYAVYSKSLRAWGVDDSGSMRYMVRFARGRNAAIGFHDIPVLGGHLVQTRSQLGSPQSHGCIRQWRPDARALWSFAPLHTRVVVVAS